MSSIHYALRKKVFYYRDAHRWNSYQTDTEIETKIETETETERKTQGSNSYQKGMIFFLVIIALDWRTLKEV